MRFKYFYKIRFLIGYVIIGILSLIIEILFYNFLINYINNIIINSLISVFVGILFSFWFNVRYNFKISKSKRNKSLVYFFIISICSYVIQIIIIQESKINLNYETLRIITSGSLFWISYLLHRKFSFKDFKKVGVAIYANGVEDLKKIFKKVNSYPDFIHIDIIDETINKNANKVLSYKSEVIRAYWNDKFIEAHIMSRKPSKWINEIQNDVDRIYIHIDLDEDLQETLFLIKKANCEVGIVIQNLNQIKSWVEHNNLIDSILVLSIEKPGYSGQMFDLNSLEIIERINKHELRKNISLNVDGGVNNSNISIIKSENVVSGSYILNSSDSIRNIMILQTSSQYEPF